MPISPEQFVKQLTDSGLMPADEVRAFVGGLPTEGQPTDGAELAKLLVKERRLTRFQVEQIYAGKGSSLTLGNYVILDKLGQGGMGMVLKAEHRRMKRRVAIKVMSPTAVKTPDALKRFHREVEAAAKLRHPNIVAADDADEAKGTHFLVMEYVDGSDLSALVKKQGPLPVDQAVKCIIQAARGLEYAHEQGVIHRDIKPANLLIDAKGTVKILDMGLARIDGAVGGSSEGAGLTQSGTIMGTVDYMSPEQAMDTKHADGLSDIYSLGCTLYYLLTGKAVYDGDTIMKKLMAHRESPIPSIVADAASVRANVGSSDASSVGHALDVVFRRMVAKRPEDRSQSMTEVIAELERCLSGDAQSGGSATVTLSRPSGVLSGETSPQFMKDNSGGSATSAASGNPGARMAKTNSQTAVAVDSEFVETMISSAGDAQTDPQTLTSMTSQTPGATAKGSAGRTSSIWQDRRVQIGGAIGVVLLLVVGFIATRNKTGPQPQPPEKTAVATGNGEPAKSNGQVSVPLTTPATTVSPPDFALQFDGVSDRVVIPTLAYKGAEPITIEARIWIDASLQKAGKLVSSGWGGLSVIDDGRLRFGAWNPGDQTQMLSLVDARPLPRERYVHVAMSWDQTAYRLFVDGELVQERQSGPVIDTTKNDGFFVGAYGTKDVSTPFHGMIDEVRISNFARYKAKFVPAARWDSDADTLALYHFDEGVGDELKDSSGNNHHGQIIGAKWVTASNPPPPVDFELQFDGKGSRVLIPTLTYKGEHPITLEATIRLEGTLAEYARIIALPWGGLNLNGDGRLRFAVRDSANQNQNQSQSRTVGLTGSESVPSGR
ncbi:MAG: protein kinase, partial [Planctomycetaceae bacterium]|nr:protein kinase [Planctomycetaceae bacterium]